MKKRIMMIIALILILGLVAERLLAETFMVSVSSDGTQGNGNVGQNSISSDGRYVSFVSDASNMVDGDTNGVSDIFVHDRQTGQTTRASVSSRGVEGNGVSDFARISSDGRYVVFHSEASNLVESDTNGNRDIFFHDRQTGETTRISVSSGGAQGNEASGWPTISLDSRYISFVSSASNLVEGDTNEESDIFIHDRQTGETTRMSVSSEGTQGNGGSGYSSISLDGRYVGFISSATNLVKGDTNGLADVFQHDRETGITTRVSLSSSGTEGNGDSDQNASSSDGRYVAFRSDATNLVAGDTNGLADIFVRDRETFVTNRISISSDGVECNEYSTRPNVSSDGRYVTFASAASNLVDSDTNEAWDIFVHDRQTGKTTRVSVSSDGREGNDHSSKNYSSSNGRYVAFASGASNLVEGDTNGVDDIFVNDLTPGDFTVYSPTSADNGVNDDGKSSVTITWIDSTSTDVDHNEIVAMINQVPEETDVVAGQNNIAPGTQSATFDWNEGDDLYVGVVAVDNMGFRKLCLNENEPNVTVVDDTVNTTTTTTVGGPCLSEVIYGEDSEETQLMRNFRDNVLSQTPLGQEIIRLYYQWSPVIVRSMDGDEVFKKEVKEIIDGVLMLITVMQNRLYHHL